MEAQQAGKHHLLSGVLAGGDESKLRRLQPGTIRTVILLASSFLVLQIPHFYPD